MKKLMLIMVMVMFTGVGFSSDMKIQPQVVKNFDNYVNITINYPNYTWATGKCKMSADELYYRCESTPASFIANAGDGVYTINDAQLYCFKSRVNQSVTFDCTHWTPVPF